MIFNSIDFAIFLPIVFITYWFFVRRYRTAQNIILLIASYVFYGWWDWRFLSLIIISSSVDYIVGLGLSKNYDNKKRKLLLILSIFINLGFLGFFKYYNFFLDNFIEAYSFFGHSLNQNRLKIILPVGISFYTFQTLSYSIDVYRRRFDATTDIVSFFAYVSFFPQLVAGPIERAKNLLPQFYNKRVFNYENAVDGLRQILWGLFKKIVIADNCAKYVNLIFDNSNDYSGSTLVLGAVFFAFQIYGDFSGYSDIAIGTARLFGFSLMRNFAFPYFSRDIAEFWRRWHISLSTWFRDYLYIPLGGSRVGTWKKIRNILLIFIVSGFWHGANWTYIVWGIINALYFIPLMILNRNRNNLNIVAKDKFFPSFKEIINIFITFSLVVFAWIFFRAESISHAIAYIEGILSLSLFTIPEIAALGKILTTIFLVSIFILIEWSGREQQYAIAKLGSAWPKPFKYAIYYTIIIAIIWFGGEKQQFIYFQF